MKILSVGRLLTKDITSAGEVANHRAHKRYNPFIFDKHEHSLIIMVNSNTAAPTDKESIVCRMGADKIYYICGRGYNSLRPQM